MLRRDLADIQMQAERIAAAIRAAVPGAKAAVVEGFSQMGSGSLPGQDLPTRLVAVHAENLEEGEIARRLRRHDPPVFARVGQGPCWPIRARSWTARKPFWWRHFALP